MGARTLVRRAVAGLFRWGRTRSSGKLAVDTAGTAALNVAALGLNFTVVLLLSHLLGASGYGAYASAFAWASVLSVVGVLGLTPLVVGRVAAYTTTGAFGLLRGL